MGSKRKQAECEGKGGYINSDGVHQEKRDLEIPIDFLPISKKQEILRNCGNAQEISGNNYKFFKRLGNW